MKILCDYESNFFLFLNFYLLFKMHLDLNYLLFLNQVIVLQSMMWYTSMIYIQEVVIGHQYNIKPVYSSQLLKWSYQAEAIGLLLVPEKDFVWLSII